MKTTIASMALLLTCCGQPFTAGGADGAGGKFADDVAVNEPAATPAVEPTSLPPPVREEDAGAPRPAPSATVPAPKIVPPVVDDAGPAVPPPMPTTTAKPDAGPPPPPPPPAACGLLGGRHGLLCGSACPSPVQGFETASCGQREACSAPPLVFSPGRDWNDDATVVLETTDSASCVLPLPDGGWYVAGPTLRSIPGTCLKATVELPKDLTGKVVRGISPLSGTPTFNVCATTATGDVRVVAISGAPVGLVTVRVSSLGLDGSCPLSC